MRSTSLIAVLVFFILFLSIAFYTHWQTPITAIAGEDAPGTWLSGMLLVVCAACSLRGIAKQSWWDGYLFFLFFIMLAVDEHFMLHEQLKAGIIFNYGKETSTLIQELPVIVAGIIGLVVAVILWMFFDGPNRVLLVAAGIFGATSVVLDIHNNSIFIEEACKLLGELFITCALVRHSNGK